jgi:hypothetical protein
MSLSSAISLTVFIFLLQVTTQPANLIGNKGEKKISCSFSFFQTFPPFFFLVLCVAI